MTNAKNIQLEIAGVPLAGGFADDGVLRLRGSERVMTKLEREIYEALLEALEPFGGKMTEEAQNACKEAIKPILDRRGSGFPAERTRVEFDREANLFRWSVKAIP